VKSSRSDNWNDTTLADIIASVSECSFEYTDDTKEAYHLVHQVLVELLKKANFGSKSPERYVPGTLLQH